MVQKLQFWLKYSLINLFIVSLIGVVLRYKIAFALPFINQKFLLHGHSHFAFSGWVVQSILALIVFHLSNKNNKDLFDKYRIILWVNLIAAYGMLFSFPIQGYGPISISFSTISIINSFAFGYLAWKDINTQHQENTSGWWLKAAILFNILSSIGTFILAYLMATLNTNQKAYLLSLYGFLHFQYNGWFFFALMGILIGWINNNTISKIKLQWVFWLFAASCIPAYFLSALWLDLPIVVYLLIILAALSQCIAWIIFIKEIKQKNILVFDKENYFGSTLIVLAGIALSIKLLLQTFSTIPSLSQIAFGFRPIVIGYLHLMLLGVVTIFIIGFIFSNKIFQLSKIGRGGALLFIAGIIINQMLLMIQGVTAMEYIWIPYINEALLMAAITMFTGLLFLNASIQKKL